MQQLDPARRPSYPIESVANVLKLLLLLREHKSLSVSAAGKAIGVAPSTAHRLLAMLQYYGFVQQDSATRKYEPGSVLIELGLTAVRQMDIRNQARPYLERLCLEVGETVHLAVLQGTNILFLESVEAPRTLRVAARTGITLPACCTAAGKAMLAELPVEQLRQLFPEELLPRATANSLATRSALERALEQVRQRGYATNNEESEPELSAVACAVRDRARRVRAAITVSAPVSRLSEEQAATIAAATRRIATAIGDELP